MRRILAATLAAIAIGALPAAAPAHRADGPTAVSAKTCSAGYKHAVINGSEKCLRRGQFCAHAYDHHARRRWPYTHYGYRCVKKDANARYHLTRA
jgi:hypothetical protein